VVISPLSVSSTTVRLPLEPPTMMLCSLQMPLQQHILQCCHTICYRRCDGVYGQEESGLPLFVTVDANGDLSLWSVNRTETTGAAECHLLEIMSAEDGGSLSLSVDWSTVICRR